MENKQNEARLVIVVRRGMVDAVYADKLPSSAEVEILDTDTTVPNEIRKTEAREKQVAESFVKIYG